MCSRTELRALAALLLGALGCPEPSEPPLLVPPPPEVTAAIKPAVVAPAPPKAEQLDAIVFEFGGKAEVRRAGSEEWLTLSVGDAVRVSDEVRTSGDGHLEIRFGEARIQVHEDSELTVTFLEAHAVRAEVHGLASGSTPDGGQLTFEGRGSGVSIVSTGGQLSLDANERRALASSLTGGARLSSDGGTVQLRAGEVSTAEGGAISKPVPIPKRVTLAVSWPAQAETNQPALVLKGRASAHAQVLVMGRRVEPAGDGTFEAHVPLKKGSQSVWVLATDPLGRRATDKRQITFDPNAPAISGKVEYR